MSLINQFCKTELIIFSTSGDVATIIDTPDSYPVANHRKQLNIEKIRTVYNIEKNIDDYERIMLQACGREKLILKPSHVASI